MEQGTKQYNRQYCKGDERMQKPIDLKQAWKKFIKEQEKKYGNKKRANR